MYDNNLQLLVNHLKVLAISILQVWIAKEKVVSLNGTEEQDPCENKAN